MARKRFWFHTRYRKEWDGANHPLRRTRMEHRLQELKDELRRLMAEEIASLKSETFGGSSKQELRVRSERLNRIRELSADLLALLTTRSKPHHSES
jgi:hypothetical protein